MRPLFLAVSFLAVPHLLAAFLFVPPALAETATTTVSITPPAQCADGIDNDGDGLIDYPSDPGCSGPGDDDETDPLVPPPTSSSGGGFFSSMRFLFQASVTVSGFAFPFADISVLRDGVFASVGKADVQGRFSVLLSDVTPGSYVFTVVGSRGDLRSMITFLARVVKARSVVFEDLFLPPAITAVRNESEILVAGATIPDARLSFFSTSSPEPLGALFADIEGRFSFSFLSTDHIPIAAMAAVGSIESPLSPFVRAGLPTSVVRGDFNGDRRVNLIDFSILVFWYKQSNPPAHIDLSGDGQVTVDDVSILLFYWTG